MLPAPWVVRVLTRVADALAKVRRRLVPSHFAAIELGTMGWVSQSVAAFCELGLPDALAAGAQTPAQLSAAGFGREDTLARMLRSLAAYDVVRYCGDGRYALGVLGKAMTGAKSVAPMIAYANAPWHVQAYTRLAQTVRTGKPGFDDAHGQGLFEFLAGDAAAGEVFDAAMQALSPLYAEPLAGAYDFSKVRSLIDIGGGTGFQVQTLVQKFPSLKAAVFELPAVAQRGRATNGVTFIEGDMFTDVPPEAECYLLSHVLHDWNDPACERILSNIRKAMTAGSRLLVYELIAPEPNNAWTQDRITDLEMLAMLTGRERTREEFEALFTRCGLRLAAVHPAAAPEAVIECVPGGSPSR